MNTPQQSDEERAERLRVKKQQLQQEAPVPYELAMFVSQRVHNLKDPSEIRQAVEDALYLWSCCTHLREEWISEEAERLLVSEACYDNEQAAKARSDESIRYKLPKKFPAKLSEFEKNVIRYKGAVRKRELKRFIAYYLRQKEGRYEWVTPMKGNAVVGEGTRRYIEAPPTTSKEVKAKIESLQANGIEEKEWKEMASCRHWFSQELQHAGRSLGGRKRAEKRKQKGA